MEKLKHMSLVKLPQSKSQKTEKDLKEDEYYVILKWPFVFAPRKKVVNCFKIVKPVHATVPRIKQGFQKQATPIERDEILRRSTEHVKNESNRRLQLFKAEGQKPKSILKPSKPLQGMQILAGTAPSGRMWRVEGFRPTPGGPSTAFNASPVHRQSVEVTVHPGTNTVPLMQMIPKVKASHSIRKFYDVSEEAKRWVEQKIAPDETKYITTSFEVFYKGLEEVAEELLTELVRWCNYGNVVCCEIAWSTPRLYRDLQLEHDMRDVVNRKLVQAKWDLCDTLKIMDVPRSQVEEAQRRCGITNTMCVFRHYCSKLLALAHVQAGEEHKNTWIFEPTEAPWRQLDDMFTPQQLAHTSVAVVNFICLKF